MTNPFNAPDLVYSALQRYTTPLLQTISALGPARVQWLGSPPGINPSNLSCWSLDGQRATIDEILKAGGR